MTPERWRKVEGVFEAARDRALQERAAFLDEACASDQSLRKEVESLLSHGEEAANFLEAPAFQLASEIVTSNVSVGQILGYYKIISEIGRGGMGVVYLAQDTRLGRRVALKLLPDHLTTDQDRVRRFRLEARAASALNHPNILTIYEIGQAGRTNFISAEFVDGRTLRERLTGMPLRLNEVVDVIAQVASALCAAHAAGIVHRDIKPENVMLRGDGIVKVLDFGLAKLIAQRGIGSNSDATTLINTDKGTFIGTTQYMSPEQMRDLEVDARTDIWSLGVMFYEIVAGHAPFEGATTGDVIAAVLNAETPPLARFSSSAPSELERILGKMLCKNREERYQSATDLLSDLNGLKQELEFVTKPGRPARSSLRGRVRIPGSQQKESQHASSVAPSGSKRQIARSVPGFKYLVSKIKCHKVGIMLSLMALVIALTVASYRHGASPPTQAITSIAVLPFANESQDQNMDYLSDGLSESLIDRLSQLPQLKVIARSSSFRFRGKSDDPQEVALALGVQALVMGRVALRDDDLQVRAELVDVRDKTQMWGEQYSGKATDFKTILADISDKISDKVHPKLRGEVQKRVLESIPDDDETYQLYLKGRFSWNKLTEDGSKKSIEYFTKAIERDPGYALAYAGLANSYIALGVNDLSPQETYPKAKEYSLKALELDDTLAEAHYAMAATKYYYDWDLAGAEKELSRTLEINSNYAMAYSLLGTLRITRGQPNNAVPQIKHALDLDPFSLLFNNRLSTAYYYARDYKRALTQVRKTLEIEPDASFLYSDMGVFYAQLGMYNEALAACQKAVILGNDDPAALSSLGITYALWGKRTEAEWVIDTLNHLAKKKYIQPYYTAVIYAALGDKDKTLMLLDKAIGERSFIINIDIDPIFDKFHPDPRYKALSERMHLQQQEGK